METRLKRREVMKSASSSTIFKNNTFHCFTFWEANEQKATKEFLVEAMFVRGKIFRKTHLL